MDGSTVRDTLAEAASDLNSVHTELTKQIRRNTKVVIVHERSLQRLKTSVVTLISRKRNVERRLVRIANMQNALTADTDEKVEIPSFPSSPDIDSDLLSSDSEVDGDNQVQNVKINTVSCFKPVCYMLKTNEVGLSVES